ncbi:MAG: sarcosine oxidase subunit alpha family protein [Hyphomicrobiaceae bacterium]
MSQPFRLPTGGRIDRSSPLVLTFDGRAVHGFAGDTVASALLANGVHLVGRSFKYHRPRGVLAAGVEEPNALLDVDRGGGRREPNVRATVAEAFAGLAVTSQNRWPSLERDLASIADRLPPVIGAGFYYKTFMWPPKAWVRLYEPLIRRAAGLGRAPDGADPERYEHRHAHCDILVVGAGPAGIAAAMAASTAGRRVILCDEQAEPGGALLHDQTSDIDDLPAQAWLADGLATLARRANVRLLARTTAVSYYNHNHVALVERLTDHLAEPPASRPRERLWQVRAREVVLATGAHERPLTFPDNDRPGIMLAEAVRIYINRYGVLPGRRIVVATNGASAYETAIDARRAGAAVSIVDTRASDRIGPELDAARAAGIEVLAGFVPIGSKGRHRVTALRVARLSPDGALPDVPDARDLACDCVAVSAGWTPAVHLFSQSRGRLEFDTARDAFLPGSSVQAVRSAGAAVGLYDLAACIASGARAGAESAGAPVPPAVHATPTLTGFAPLPPDLPLRLGGKAFVDFQNDVTAKDLALAVSEGFESIEHVKRYTTSGMATDQGKTSSMATMGLVATRRGLAVPAVGTTTFRPPYTPVSFGALAGQSRDRLFDPVRTTPVHDWAAAQGARFEDVGSWKRAHYFPRASEDMAAAVRRETIAVRGSVGLFDASTLGKIEVVGPDAGRFLDLMYAGIMSTLAVGRCRYGLMLKEDGFILDDGIVARLADDRFHVTTTTGGAARVLAHMEDYLQTEFTTLRVFLTSITEQWAVIAVQGPKARETIAPLVDDLDLVDAAFPHMSIARCRVAGVPARLMRASFTGERGFEINVPADYGRAVWEAVFAAGRAHQIAPYGTEAMHVLRAEKGFIIVGQETDGTVTPDDVGLARLVSVKKPDFVGKRSLRRPDLSRPNRKQLVGLLSDAFHEQLDEGAQIVAHTGQPIPMTMLGHVTSSYMSACAGRAIALALLADGRHRIGETVHVTTADGFTRATVARPVFIDPEGNRVHG